MHQGFNQSWCPLGLEKPYGKNNTTSFFLPGKWSQRKRSPPKKNQLHIAGSLPNRFDQPTVFSFRNGITHIRTSIYHSTCPKMRCPSHYMVCKMFAIFDGPYLQIHHLEQVANHIRPKHDVFQPPRRAHSQIQFKKNEHVHHMPSRPRLDHSKSGPCHVIAQHRQIGQLIKSKSTARAGNISSWTVGSLMNISSSSPQKWA